VALGDQIWCEGFSGPSQRDAAVADGAANNPDVVGEGITKQPPFGVGTRLGDHHSNSAAGTEGQAGHTRRNGTGAEVPERAIGSPDRYWQALWQAHPLSHLPAQLEYGGCGQHWWQLLSSDICQFERVGVPISSLQ
jgi:hypothetical protein